MEKHISIDSWSFHDYPVHTIKASSRGLTNHDYLEFKKYAAKGVVEYFKKCDLKPGDIPIHVVALGAYEAWGPNKNGDAFTEKACEEYHHTFVTTPARYYKHHKNKDPKISFGKVAYSCYNKGMKRVELLVIANGTKEAAERNGGLVLDDETLNRLERNDPIGWSMACKVAYDVCSICGNKAPNRLAYCTETTCRDPVTGTKGLGCRNNLMKFAEDGRLQFVYNPEPLFFDISQVLRPADRSAWGGKLTKEAEEFLGKTASELSDLSSYLLVSAYNRKIPTQLAPVFLKTAEVLAEQEIDIAAGGYSPRDLSLGVALAVPQQQKLAFLGDWKKAECGLYLTELAKSKCFIPPDIFFRSILPVEDEDLVKAACNYTKGVFNRLFNNPSQLIERLRSSPFVPEMDYTVPLEIKQACQRLKPWFSLEKHELQKRAAVAHSVFLEYPHKQIFEDSNNPSKLPILQDLADQYGLYKIAATVLSGLHNNNNFCRLIVLQNWVTL